MVASPFDAFISNPAAWAVATWSSFLSACGRFRFGCEISNLLSSTSRELSFDLFASWTIVFLVLYLLFALMWKLIPGTGLQKGALPFVASSRCIGTVHFSFVCPLAMVALTRQNPNWFALEYLGLNSALEQRLTELSVGYFTADFVHFVLFEPDVLMFFHHVFSLLMLGSAGIMGRGATCSMVALVSGEVTNPFQSAWTVAKAAKAQRLLNWLSPLFTLAFVGVRVPIVPIWTMLYINPNILWGSPHVALVPRWLTVSWATMDILMTLGGWAWSWMLIRGLRKFYAQKGKNTQGQGQQQSGGAAAGKKKQ